MKAIGAPSERLRRSAVQHAVKAGFRLDVRASDIRFTELGRRTKSVLNRVEATAVSGGNVVLIEKLSRSKSEARFCEVCRNQPLAPGLDLLPPVHQTLIRDWMPELLFFTAAIYMEELTTGFILPDAELGRVAARITRLGEAEVTMPVAPSLTPADVRRWAAAVRRDPRRHPDVLCEVDALYQRLTGFLSSAFWAAIPRVVCHNDLHQANFGRRAGDPGRLVVLDWEAVGLKRVGSDLDRVFPVDGSRRGEISFASAAEAYRHGLAPYVTVEPAVVEIAAGVAALQRRMRRYLKDRTTGRDRLTDVLRTWRRLEARLPS